jgi:CheY-like chemotaxis protein
MWPTILLVEDDPVVARMLMFCMQVWGYEALHATTSQEALTLAEAHRDEIALTICDIMLPDAPGRAVAASIRMLCPEMQTCFMSGYTMDLLRERGLLPQDCLLDTTVTYLQKPFMPQVMHDLITRVLDETRTPRESVFKRNTFYASAAY